MKSQGYCLWKLLTSPTSASVTLGLNLWSARPTWTVCVCAGAELVELAWFDVLDGALAFAVTDAASLDVLSCAIHTAGSCLERKDARRNARSHDDGLNIFVLIFGVLRLITLYNDSSQVGRISRP
jgi:hypothetical protein